MNINHDINIEDMCKRYHKKLTSFGDKVTAESYPFEQLHNDFVRFYMPKNTFLLALVCAFMDGPAADQMLLCCDNFIKKHEITEENVLPMFFFI